MEAFFKKQQKPATAKSGDVEMEEADKQTLMDKAIQRPKYVPWIEK